MACFTGNRFLPCALLLLALLLQAAIPAGFMPGKTGDGTVQMVICTGTGPATITVDADDAPGLPHDGKHNKGEKDHAPCPFTPFAAQNLDAPPLALALNNYENHLVFHNPLPARTISLKPWLAQGPPVLM